MAISKKLEIIYHNGQPDGIRSIRRHLSTMTTYVIPRPRSSDFFGHDHTPKVVYSSDNACCLHCIFLLPNLL